MTIDPVTRSALDVVDHCQQSRVLDVRRPAAARTDHVMVVAGLAGDVGMVATGQVNALDRSQLDEHLKGPEHRRPADSQAPRLSIGEQVSGREVAVSSGDEVRDGSSGPGQAVAGSAQGQFG